ncbi:MAG: DUF393 domain-containing protein [Halobacteriovoraceae bacterium]|nr:DUF393 domain-containing protein [Halobacteriovoraceae bacterium]MCB9095668.1 DUF393 domain-containing protein [Halobacteriovoraceae bacterium]
MSYFNFQQVFTLDKRSLALMRVILCLFLLFDLYEQLPYLEMFYSDNGLFPISLWLNDYAHDWSYSLLYLNNSLIFFWASITCYAIALFSMLIGFRTKGSNFWVWLFFVSFNNRNWFGLNGGDDLVRIMLLILLFLPTHHFYSIDKALNKSTEPKSSYQSLWCFVFIWQLLIMYFFSALFKNHPIWNHDYTALSFALKLYVFSTPFGEYFQNYPAILKFLSFATYWSELLIPIALIISLILRKSFFRLSLIFYFISFHLGILLLLNVGNFPLYAMSFWLALIPSQFWDKFSLKPSQELTMYYDGGCNFCKKLVMIIREFLFLKNIKAYPSYANYERLQEMKKNDSWIVKDQKGHTHHGFSAFLIIVNSTWYLYPFFIFNNKVLASLGEKGYRFIADHRSLFSKFTKPLHWSPLSKKSTFPLKEFFAFVMLLSLLNWPLSHSQYSWSPKITNFLNPLNQWLHTYQNWNLFAPYPQKTNTWHQVIGTLDDGHKIDLINPGRSVLIEKLSRKEVANDFHNKLMRKLFLRLEQDDSLADPIARFYCQNGNRRAIEHKKLLTRVEIVQFKEVLVSPNVVAPQNNKLLITLDCL